MSYLIKPEGYKERSGDTTQAEFGRKIQLKEFFNLFNA